MEYLIGLVMIGLSTGMVYALVALGLSFIYSGLDFLHFAHGEIYMIGAFVGLFAFQTFAHSFPAALVVGIVISAFIGILIERVFYRRLAASGGGYSVEGMGAIICGFGMSMVLQNVVFLIMGPLALPFPVQFGMPFNVGTVTLPRTYLVIMVVALGLMTALHLLLTRTSFGLAARAVAYNKDVAFLMGVNVPLAISGIFGIGCGLAAGAGVLIAPLTYVSILMGFKIMLNVFSAAVVGGLGSFRGAIAGGLLVGLAESLGAGYISASLKDVYAFFLMMLVLMIRPAGIFGVDTRIKA